MRVILNRALIISAIAFTANVQAIALNETCASKFEHWREYAYNTERMLKYKPYASCVEWSAFQFNLPEELIYSIIYRENGGVEGRCPVNPNKTKDCGPTGINDVRMGELAKFDIDQTQLKSEPCKAIWSAAYLLRKEINKVNGDFWLGVGNYHYNRKAGPKTHAIYVHHIRDAWMKLVALRPSC